MGKRVRSEAAGLLRYSWTFRLNASLPAASRTTTTLVRYAASAALAAAALYAIVRRLDRHELATSLSAADREWVVAAVVSVFVTLSLVTLRWGLLVAPSARRARWRILWHSVILGQAVNILIPLRFGEGTRIVMTARYFDLPLGRVATAAALERLFDVAAFTAAALLIFSMGALPATAAGRAPVAAVLALLTAIALIVFLRLLPMLAARRNQQSDSRVMRWVQTQAAAVGQGWTLMASPPRLIAVSALTVVILLSSALTNVLMLRAFNLAVPATAAVVLLIVLQIGTAVVSVPGNIGVFHYLTVLTLAQWHVPPPAALAAAIVLHAVSIGPKLLLAPFALLDRPARA